MKKIFLSSDSHFNHENIIRYCDRPFKDVSHMNEMIVKAWNETVTPDDIVYYLGDMLMGRMQDGMPFPSRLNGTIHLVAGNHDEKALRFQWFRERFASIQEELNIEYNGKKIFLKHYFNTKFDRKNVDHYFHGHGHSKGDSLAAGISLDIGVDAAYSLLGSYRPFSIDEAIQISKEGEDDKMVRRYRLSAFNEEIK